MRCALAVALALVSLWLPGAADASNLPAGRLFGLQCIKAGTDPYGCQVALSPPLNGGQAVAASPTGTFVWAGDGDGVLWVFRRVAAGRLAAVACQDSGTDCPVANAIAHLDSVDALAAGPGGRDLYVVDTASAALHVLHVLGDGRLTDGGCFDQGSLCGAGNSVPSLSHASDVAVSGDGHNVYVAAGSPSNAVSTFARAADGSLTYQGCIANSNATCAVTAPGLVGAHGVDVSPRGGSVYVAATGANFGGTADGSVAALTRNADGSLAANGCVEQTGAPPPCASNGPGLVDPVAVSASGNAVYVASRDGLAGAESSVTTLPRAGDGSISYGSCYAFTGSSQCGAGRAIPGIDNALDIALSGDERTVHTTALGGSVPHHGAVVTFARSATGALSPAGCLGEFDSPETGCSKTRAIESAGEAIDIAPDGVNVYAGTAAGLAVLGREVGPFCNNAAAVVPGKTSSVPVPCFDPNGDALTHFAVAGPAHGDLGDFDDAANAVRYKPEPGFVGADFLTYRAFGGSLISNLGTLTITVTNVRPSVTRLRLSRKRFRRGRKLPRASRRRAKVGTSIRFRLSEPARATLSFERVLAGRKVGRRCKPPRRGLRSHKRCKRYRRVRRTIRVRGDTGGNSVGFQGRVSRGVRLRPGSYRLTVVAKDKQGVRSRRKRVRFRLVR